MAPSPAFLKLYGDLPRQGVGTDWCTREAIHRLPPLRKPPAILDLGCGSGRQTMVLAQHFRSPIEAVDHCQLFLDQMMDAAKASGVDEFIRPRCDNFRRLPDQPASYDLVWGEGVANLLGFATALRTWGALLRGRGIMVLSEPTWLSSRPSAQAEAFWRAAYPEMTDIPGNLETAKKNGMAVFDHFVLPKSAWWDEYLGPLSRQASALRQAGEDDPELGGLIDDALDRISLFERYGDSFGYVFYLMRPA